MARLPRTLPYLVRQGIRPTVQVRALASEVRRRRGNGRFHAMRALTSAVIDLIPPQVGFITGDVRIWLLHHGMPDTDSNHWGTLTRLWLSDVHIYRTGERARMTMPSSHGRDTPVYRRNTRN